MEEKLKKQRNRLFLRIILIMMAVWLSVSAIFCAVRLGTEKLNVQSSELSSLSYVKSMLTIGNGGIDAVNRAFLEYSDLVYSGDGGENLFDSQIVITDRKTNRVIADTAETIVVRFAMKNGEESAQYVVGLLSYSALRGALSDRQYEVIDDYLNREPGDGNYYELVCTEFLLGDVEIIPMKLELVLVDGTDPRFTVGGSVCTFELNNSVQGYSVREGSTLTRNTIPKEFLLNGAYNRDYIGSLSSSQRKSSTDMIRTGALEYIFYATDYLNYDNTYANAENDAWMIEYAKRINLFENCKTDLTAGVLLAFCFFLTIAVILCVMIWQTIRTQIVQEQRRLDLTNALAHDIKTPLFVISGYAYSLKENIDEAERDEYLDKILEQTEEVNSLVHRMLSFSKLDSYNMKLNKTQFDLGELADELAGKYISLPEGRHIELSRSGDNVISADRELVGTVLQNLIDNAVKYSIPGSRIKIEVTGGSLSISNQSESMTASELKQLWKPYVRRDKSRSKRGSGLGLSIVKSILDLHGAKYHMEMKDGVFKLTAAFEK